MVKIIHARINEIGTISGGQPGDQTGREVCRDNWYENEWEYVFRPISPEVAKAIVADAEKIAANDYIGYGNGERYTMFNEAKKLHWQFDKITTPCATDCSQMIATLCIANGIPVSQWMYTGNEKGVLMNTGAFEQFMYLPHMFLKSGDIVLTTKKGHTVLVVEGSEESYPEWVGECYGAEFVTVRTAPDEKAGKADWSTLGTGNLFVIIGEEGDWFRIKIADKYEGYIQKRYVLRKTVKKTGIVISDVYVRANAGASYKALGVLKTGTTAEICDTKKAANGADWYYIKYHDAWGFSSAKYIK